MFGSDVVEKFLEKHDLDLICRAHQVGFFFFFLALYLSFLFLALQIFSLARSDGQPYQNTRDELRESRILFHPLPPFFFSSVCCSLSICSESYGMFFFFVVNKVVEDGYQFFAHRRLVTVFSAPNYCNEFDNAGAIMSVDPTLMCSFQVSDRLSMIRVFSLCLSLFLSTSLFIRLCIFYIIRFSLF